MMYNQQLEDVGLFSLEKKRLGGFDKSLQVQKGVFKKMMPNWFSGVGFLGWLILKK